ncbi:hypothetical protein [Salibaculum griseiflavum]|uniref:Lipoprotein n=1 Tax=Salibaculum griseiflavum TaxID=1914409 RepID=A0A2V1P387_9RHOB|nr:hypothetical protein [Salibaculum griseiflavum]PWG16875.1 hypothetical protein DFK10_08850 [Salibaculum griseiflavum]
MLRTALSIFCVVLALMAGCLFVHEYRHFREASRSLNERIPRHATSAKLAEPASLSRQVDQMRFCVDAPQTVLFSIYPDATRQGFSEACLSQAQTILRSSPTVSIAWLAKGVSLAQLDQPGPARAALANSRLCGPREGWIAIRRLRLALTLDVGASDRGAPGLSNDIHLLASDPKLRRDLAELFVRSGTKQDLIISMMEEAPAEDQRLFLREVRRINER